MSARSTLNRSIRAPRRTDAAASGREVTAPCRGLWNFHIGFLKIIARVSLAL